MRKMILALAASTLIAGSALAQQKVTVEIEAPEGFSIKRSVTAPAAGYANWCINKNQGKIVADANQCKGGHKSCVNICVDAKGERIMEPWKATAK